MNRKTKTAHDTAVERDITVINALHTAHVETKQIFTIAQKPRQQITTHSTSGVYTHDRKQFHNKNIMTLLIRVIIT